MTDELKEALHRLHSGKCIFEDDINLFEKAEQAYRDTRWKKMDGMIMYSVALFIPYAEVISIETCPHTDEDYSYYKGGFVEPELNPLHVETFIFDELARWNLGVNITGKEFLHGVNTFI